MYARTKFNQITIFDKSLFDKYIYKHCYGISEFTFTYFLIWRDFLCLEFCELMDTLLIRGKLKNQTFSYFTNRET